MPLPISNSISSGTFTIDQGQFGKQSWQYSPDVQKAMGGYFAGAAFASLNMMNPALAWATPMIAHVSGLTMAFITQFKPARP